MLQQLNQLDTEIQHGNITLENSQMKPSTSKKVPPQRATWSEFSIPTPFVFDLMTERQERENITEASNSYKNLTNSSMKSLPIEN